MSATEERYARAIRSSHLECTDRAGDIDALIAAGMVRDGIGPDLLRLRADYDSMSHLPGARNAIKLLKRMPHTRDRVLKFAEDIAAAKQFEFTPADLTAIVVRVIDLYLSPNCPPCGGTGLVGEFGSVRNTCPACGGAKRRSLMWDNDATERFVQVLQVRMESKVDSASRRISILLR